jgi:AraC-like DNA-binding protein
VERFAVKAAQRNLSVSSRLARRLVPVSDALGFDGPRLCERHGLPRAVLDDPGARVPLDRTLDLLEELLESRSSAALGLLMARSSEPDAYHTPALILLASETLKAGFERAFAYQRLWGDGERFALRRSHSLGVVEPGHAVTFQLPLPRRPAVAVLEICALAETLAAVRGLSGRPAELPVALGLPECSDDLAAVVAGFGVEPALGTRVAFVAFGEEVLKARLSNANAVFRAIFERQAQAELARLPAVDELLPRLRAELARELATGKFGLAASARSLGLTRRTLERRLAERGTSYVEELEAVRREQAVRWLAEGRPIEEISVLLGYSERSAFHRACLRWFGRTPVALRRSAARARDG